MATINWPGASGNNYEYYIHPIGTRFKNLAGNYIFARETKPNYWAPVYIGETADLSSRFNNHHQADAIKRNGATHIHVHSTTGGAQVRRDEETDLRRKWNPPCNEQ
jgi:predicted GIY-YIG superfamily endonuclease